MNPPITTVLFDAVGTLIYLPRTVGDHYQEAALPFGVDLAAGQLDHAFRVAWKDAPARASTVGPRPDDDKGWWRDLVRRVIDDTLPAAQRHSFPFEVYFEAVYAHFAEPGVWYAYAEVTAVLADLKSRGLKLGLVSNFDRRLYAVLAHLGLAGFFAKVVISSEVGIDKPAPAIFRLALDTLAARPAEAVHVGDDPKCDWGATAAGPPGGVRRRTGDTRRGGGVLGQDAAARLAPMPVGVLPGVGPVQEARLRRLRLTHVRLLLRLTHS